MHVASMIYNILLSLRVRAAGESIAKIFLRKSGSSSFVLIFSPNFSNAWYVFSCLHSPNTMKLPCSSVSCQSTCPSRLPRHLGGFVKILNLFSYHLCGGSVPLVLGLK